MIKINISRDFSDAPGGRFISEGPHSGEEFLKTLLIPKYREALETNDTLEINLDGCYGYPSSFIDEAFSGLAKSQNSHDVLKIIKFISEDQPGLIEQIEKSVKDAVLKG